MEFLPDDIWRKILQVGIENNRLDRTDLCSLAIVNNHFDQLTRDPALWGRLIRRDFPFSILFSFQTPSKGLYKHKYELRKERLSYDWSFLQIDGSLLPTPPAWNWPIWPPPIIIGGDQWTRYKNRIQDLRLQRTSHSRSSQSNFSNSATRVYSGQESNLAIVTIGDFGDVSSFFEGGFANQPILTKEKKQYYEKKPKCFDKCSKPKVIPSSKSYIPMNRAPRRSMPRKI